MSPQLTFSMCRYPSEHKAAPALWPRVNTWSLAGRTLKLRAPRCSLLTLGNVTVCFWDGWISNNKTKSFDFDPFSVLCLLLSVSFLSSTASSVCSLISLLVTLQKTKPEVVVARWSQMFSRSKRTVCHSLQFMIIFIIASSRKTSENPSSWHKGTSPTVTDSNIYLLWCITRKTLQFHIRPPGKSVIKYFSYSLIL